MREKGKTTTKHQVEATGATLLRWKPVDPKWRRGVSPSPRYRVRKKSVQKERGKGGGGVFFTPKGKYNGEGWHGEALAEISKDCGVLYFDQREEKTKGGKEREKKKNREV